MAKLARFSPTGRTKQTHVPLFRIIGSMSKSKRLQLIITGGQERHITQAGGITQIYLREANRINRISSRATIMELQMHTSHHYRISNLKGNMQVRHLSNKGWRI